MYFETANFVFFFMTFGMYILMYIGGNVMRKAKNSKDYWRASIIPVMAFALNMGLRWGRGIDYNNGYYAYERIAKGFGNAEDYEPLWRLTIGFFRNVLGAHWQVMVFFLSFFLISSFVFFLKNHREIGHIALPLFAFLAFPSENLIRWFYSFSFVLIGLYYIEKGRTWRYIIWAVLGVLTHYGSALFSVPFLIIISFFKEKALLAPWLSIPIFFAIFFFFKTTDMLMFTSLFNMVEVEGNFSQYQTNIEDVLTNSFGDFEGAITGTSLITFPILLFLGYEDIQQRKNLVPLYNIMLVGIVLMPAFARIQMTSRVVMVYSIFQCIIMAYLVKDYLTGRNFGRNLVSGIAMVMVLVFFRSMVVQPFTKEPDQTYYVWNANGRKTL